MKTRLTTNMQNFLDIPIAHRGWHDEKISENSMLAFKKAIDKGVAIEIDLRLTADNVLVVFHDHNLKRMTGVAGEIEELTYKQLQNYSLYDGQKIPTFKEVLSLVAGRVPLLIEFKVHKKNQRALVDKAMQLLEGYDRSTVAFQSFYPQCLRYGKKTYPQIAFGQLGTYDFGKKFYFKFLVAILVAFEVPMADFLSFDVRFLPRKSIQKYRQKGKKVLCWLVNTEQKHKIALQNSDNIIFEKIFD